MHALQILILVMTPSLVVFSVWTLLSVRELWPRAGRPPIPTTPAPRDIISSGDLAPVIEAPDAPGSPATVTAPAPFEFEISCVGAACQGSRSCQLVWRCLGAPERSDYRPVGTHLAEAVDQSSVWACSCGLAPELIPTECRAIIQTHYNPEAPGAFPLVDLVVDGSMLRGAADLACRLVQYTVPASSVRQIWCRCQP